MVKKEGTVEPTVTINRKKLVTAGWIAGGVLALGATFAAGAAIGHVTDGPRGGDFAAGQSDLSGEFGPQGGHGGERDRDRDRDGGGHGDQTGQHEGGPNGDQAGQHKGGPDGGRPVPAPAETP